MDNDLARIGDWIQTYTGGNFYPLDPRSEDINIRDIAHSLSLLCRFNGHCTKFYSVAEHSVHVAAGVALATDSILEVRHALLHDSAEAYLSDVPRPTKGMMPGYKDLEKRVEDAIAVTFSLDTPLCTIAVKEIDFRMLSNEQTLCMAPPPLPWHLHPKGPVEGITIEFWAPEEAEQRFLECYHQLWP